MRITVVGCGYVGLVAAACYAELGHEVICVDNSAEKIGALQAGETPIHEEFLPELLKDYGGKTLRFTTALSEAVRASSVIFIAVGTPPCASGEADLSSVESVAREIAQSLTGYKVVVEKSTVPVSTNDAIRRVMSLNKGARGAFDVISNPEFLREGTAVIDFLYPDRIVIGSDSERATALLQQVYCPLTDGSYYKRKDAIPAPDHARIPAPLVLTSAASAELIKHASNAFLAMKISFINAVASICETVGADVEEVRTGMGLDSRIGPRFLHPGIGYGGSCFPKDLSAFRAVARESGYDFRLLEEVTRINEEQKQRFLRKLRKALWTLKGKHVGVLGLAFKGGTDDIRESPAIGIVESLLQEGVEITAYDPAAMDRAEQVLPPTVKFACDAYAAAEEVDALVILTDWEEFANLDLRRLRPLMHYPIIVDGRNLYDPSALTKYGFFYMSVGRPDMIPQRAPNVRRVA